MNTPTDMLSLKLTHEPVYFWSWEKSAQHYDTEKAHGNDRGQGHGAHTANRWWCLLQASSRATYQIAHRSWMFSRTGQKDLCGDIIELLLWLQYHIRCSTGVYHTPKCPRKTHIVCPLLRYERRSWRSMRTCPVTELRNKRSWIQMQIWLNQSLNFNDIPTLGLWAECRFIDRQRCEIRNACFYYFPIFCMSCLLHDIWIPLSHVALLPKDLTFRSCHGQ